MFGVIKAVSWSALLCRAKRDEEEEVRFFRVGTVE